MANSPRGRNGGPQKSAGALRTISEVAEELSLPQHVLRFWESKFQQIKPMKRGGGRRYYRPEDLDLLRRIRDLLYVEGYTIKGVQKLLREKGEAGLASSGTAPGPATAGQSSGAADTAVLRELLGELEEIRELL